MKLSNEWKGMIAAFLTYTIFGGGWITAGIAYDSIGENIVLAWRFIPAVILMTIIGIAGGKLHFKGKKWWKLLLLGVICPVLGWTFEARGLVLTNASFSSVTVALTPIVALFAAQVFLKEKPTAWQVFFSVFSIAGVIIVTIVGSSMGTVTLAGVVALLLCIACTVVFNLFSRNMAEEFSAFERTYAMMVIGTLWFVPRALFACRHDFTEFWSFFAEPELAVSVLYLGIMSSVCGHFLLNYSLGKLTVARVSVFSNWTTVVAVLGGVLILHEPFTVVQMIASVMILVGLYGVNHFTAEKQPALPQQNEEDVA